MQAKHPDLSPTLARNQARAWRETAKGHRNRISFESCNCACVCARVFVYPEQRSFLERRCHMTGNTNAPQTKLSQRLREGEAAGFSVLIRQLMVGPAFASQPWQRQNISLLPLQAFRDASD